MIFEHEWHLCDVVFQKEPWMWGMQGRTGGGQKIGIITALESPVRGTDVIRIVWIGSQEENTYWKDDVSYIGHIDINWWEVELRSRYMPRPRNEDLSVGDVVKTGSGWTHGDDSTREAGINLGVVFRQEEEEGVKKHLVHWVNSNIIGSYKKEELEYVGHINFGT